MNSWHWSEVWREQVADAPVPDVVTLADGDRITADSGQAYWARRTPTGQWWLECEGFVVVHPTDSRGMFRGIQQLGML